MTDFRFQKHASNYITWGNIFPFVIRNFTTFDPRTMKLQLTDIRYFGLNWYAPKNPKIMKIMWRKLARIGAHMWPKKSNTCRSIIVSCKVNKKLISNLSINLIIRLLLLIESKTLIQTHKIVSRENILREKKEESKNFPPVAITFQFSQTLEFSSQD